MSQHRLTMTLPQRLTEMTSDDTKNEMERNWELTRKGKERLFIPSPPRATPTATTSPVWWND
jgi:hypothetical protein